MPTELRLAFWNVQNLFEPGVVARGPQDAEELNAKLDNVARAIQQFFGGQEPDILSLAEVNTGRILNDLKARLSGTFHAVWEPAGVSDQTGLGVLANAQLVSSLRIVAAQRPSQFARPRAIVVECELIGKPEPLLLIVNHWKSRLPSSPITDEADRRQTADWLGQSLASERRTRCVVLVGDFNAEPFEPPFGELRLKARRTFSSALWTRATPAYVYNTAWRFLSEPDPWEQTLVPAYRATRPKGTHAADLVFDQLLVSGAALRGGLLTLRDSSVALATIDQLTSRFNRQGACVPLPWSYVSAVEYSGTSDHLPLTAVFSVN